jgi:hypothetical protein
MTNKTKALVGELEAIWIFPDDAPQLYYKADPVGSVKYVRADLHPSEISETIPDEGPFPPSLLDDFVSCPVDELDTKISYNITGTHLKQFFQSYRMLYRDWTIKRKRSPDRHSPPASNSTLNRCPVHAMGYGDNEAERNTGVWLSGCPTCNPQPQRREMPLNDSAIKDIERQISDERMCINGRWWIPVDGNIANPPVREYGFEERLVKTLRLVLPMARGYAAMNPVGNNQEFIMQADQLLKDMEDGG